MLILGRKDVEDLLDGADGTVLELVRAAYVTHAAGRSALPYSTFLRFPDDDRNRIIGLPGHLGGDRPATGIKWISSFPGNPAAGLERASAVIVLNSLRTGHVEALLEASVISARRTGAGAALAARALGVPGAATGITLVGCGPINAEVLRFCLRTVPELAATTLYDLDPARVDRFAAQVAARHPELAVHRAADPDAALAAHRLVSLATTAPAPHLSTAACAPGTVVLHVSLRDLTVGSILAARNVVDDTDHVTRERTSIHLAALHTGHRDFVSAEIGAVLRDGPAPAPDAVTVYSPFGLGVLDLALAEHVRTAAEAAGAGVRVPHFHG